MAAAQVGYSAMATLTESEQLPVSCLLGLEMQKLKQTRLRRLLIVVNAYSDRPLLVPI